MTTFLEALLGTVAGGVVLAYLFNPFGTRNKLKRFGRLAADFILRRKLPRCIRCGSQDREDIDFNSGTAYRADQALAITEEKYRCNECGNVWTDTHEHPVERP